MIASPSKAGLYVRQTLCRQKGVQLVLGGLVTLEFVISWPYLVAQFITNLAGKPTTNPDVLLTSQETF